MKTLIKILLIAAILSACVFVAGYLFLALQGKTLITKQLEDLTRKKVSIGYIGLTLPLNLEIRSLNIDGLAKVEYVSVSPSITGLITGKLVLNELRLVRPEVTYERKAANKISKATDRAVDNPGILIPAALVKVQPLNKPKINLAFKHLDIKDGKINFIDYTVGSEGIRITISDFNLNLTNLYLYPHSATTDFTISAKIPWQEGQQEGSFKAEGWINLWKRDMQASLKISDIDGVYLYPYYSQWVDLEKARIEKAKLNVTSNIQSVNGNLTAPCHLELSDIVFKKPEVTEGEDKTQKIMSAVMDVLSAVTKSNKIVFNFTYKGKMPSFY